MLITKPATRWQLQLYQTICVPRLDHVEVPVTIQK